MAEEKSCSTSAETTGIEQQVLDEFLTRLKADPTFDSGMAERLYQKLSSAKKVKALDLVVIFQGTPDDPN